MLGDLRLSIYQKIAEQSKRRSPKGWPLWVSPIQRVLLSASLTSEPIVPSSEIVGREADICIVDGFITELELALEDLSPTETHGKITGAEDTAVSWHDARIFLAAFARLTSEEQASSFESLLLPIDRCFSRLLADDAGDSVAGDREIASFLARLVTLCVNTYVMMLLGSDARDELHRVVGKYEPDLPYLLPSDQWYYADKAFIGVFDDWQDSELPAVQIPSNIGNQNGGEATLQRVLESALSFGFVTAKNDRCHLLYAAWNALGKGDLWNAIPSKVQQMTTLPKNLSMILLQLRDDVSLVHRLALRATSSFHPTSTLSKAIDLKDTAAKMKSHQTLTTEVKSQLRIMIKKASRLVDKLLDLYVPTDSSMDQDIPPEVFCIFEACSAYISFAVSSYTKPKCDFFSSTMLSMTERSRRERDGCSSDSEGRSDGGSEASNDALVDTMERFQDVCDCVGAAPAHPDWLDKECRLWDGVSPGEASEAAYEAQACLTKLLLVGLTRSQLSHQLALNRALGQDQDNLAVFASKSWWLREVESSDSGGSLYDKGERTYKADIGELCGLDPVVVNVVLPESTAGSRHAAKECWQAHCAQRVLGRYQELFRNSLVSEVESAELRASGEWEVLLSGALTSASVRVAPGDDAGADEDACEAIARSQRWFGVCGSAVDALVPSVALLRFGLCTGGRAAHPLSSVDISILSFESNKAAIVEEMPSGITVSKSVSDMIMLTLAAVAMYPPNQTCDAVATHLLVDVTVFESLRGMHACTIALEALAVLQDVLDSKKGKSQASTFVIERIGRVLKTCGSDRNDNERRKPTYLLSCLRRKGGLPFVSLDTLLSRDVDPSLALSRAVSFGDTDPPMPGSWNWEGARDRFVQCLLSPFWREDLHANVESLCFFADAVSSMLVMESSTSSTTSSTTLLDLLSPIIDAFNQIPDDTLAEVIGNYICKDLTAEEKDGQRGVQESLSTIFAFLLASRNGRPVFSRVDLVFSVLEESYNTWKAFPLQSRGRIMEMMLLFACRSNNLFQLGSRLFEDLKAQQKVGSYGPEAFKNVKLFTDFLFEVRAVLWKNSSQVAATSPPLDKIASPPLPEKCSFAINNDFHDQHWYNCYTCGLTSDKGCCSLCTIVCHQGHDVEYARRSSFFCDCGGDESPESQRKCKCLTAHARDRFLKRIRSEGGEATAEGMCGDADSLVLSAPLCAKIAQGSFAQEAQRAISELSEKGQKAGWEHFLFECTKEKFRGWREHHDAATDIFSLEKVRADSYSALSNSLSARKQPLKIGKLSAGKYSSLGLSSGGTFQTKMSTDSASDRVKRNRLSNIGIVRSSMDADSRGRIVVAEPRGLIFCNGLPIVASLCSTTTEDTSFSRSSMRVISTISVGIHVVGLKFARDNERMLLVWGIDEAKMVFMHENLTAADYILALDFGKRGTESEIVVDAHWLHGSGTCAVIGLRRSLLVFDLNEASKTSVSPAAIISLESCGSNLQDFAVVPCGSKEIHRWKLFALMDDGRILTTAVERKEDGGTIVEVVHDPDVRLPTPSRDGDDPRSDRKGVSVTYLHQSNILLYQSSSSAVTALLLDEWGNTKSQFELLPFDLSVSDGGEVFNVKGPYTHWRQLGTVRHGSTDAFRVCCSAKSSTAGEPILVCLEFDEKETRVQEFTRSSPGWFDPPLSCEGSAVFTAPFLRGTSGATRKGAEKSFVERVFLCTLTLDGCLHIHGEESASPARSALESTGGTTSELGHVQSESQNSVFDVLKFEQLTNVTESERLVINADGLGR